jgi:hypothetical protein
LDGEGTLIVLSDEFMVASVSFPRFGGAAVVPGKLANQPSMAAEIRNNIQRTSVPMTKANVGRVRQDEEKINTDRG